MKFITLYSLMITLSLIHQNPLLAQSDYMAKAEITKESYFPAEVSTILSFSGIVTNNRVLLNWTIDKNQAVNQIEVERSSDEKNFFMVGLVFGTDQPDKVDYLFYEKNKKAKFFYRLKIINKDLSIVYSSIIVPESATTKH